MPRYVPGLGTSTADEVPTAAVTPFTRAAAADRLPARRVAVSSKPANDDRPILYVHLHKAGGTTACAAFTKCGHKIHRGDANCYNGDCNCNCFGNNESIVGNATEILQAFSAANASVCFIERAQDWANINFAELHKVARIVLVMRDPWSRFWSNYEREYYECVHWWTPADKQHDPLTPGSLEEYANMQGKCAPTANNWGVVYPNFYVRSLVGKAGGNGTGTTPIEGRLPVDESDLQTAKAALAFVDDALILEAEDYAERLSAVAGCQAPIKVQEGVSSTADQHHLPVHLVSQKLNTTFRKQWEQDNSLDLTLYEWVKSLKNGQDSSSDDGPDISSDGKPGGDLAS